jgi:hypothetical protein
MPTEPGEVEELRAAFVRAVNKGLNDPNFGYARLADLLGESDYPLDVIVEHFPFDVFESMHPDALRAVQSQLEDTARRVNTRLGWPFDDLDPNVIFFTRRHAAELITSLTDSQRQSLNALLTRRNLSRSSVDQIAAELRQIVGLHPRWANAVTNFHQRLLDDGVHPAFARKQSEKYQQRLIRARAWTIARTEVMKAQNMGQKIGWQQAIDMGNLPGTALMKWVAAIGHPIPPCPICLALHDSTVPFPDGRFETTTRLASGQYRFHAAETPPIHPNCRCRLVLVQPSRPSRLRIGPPEPFHLPQPPPRRKYTVSRRKSPARLSKVL